VILLITNARDLTTDFIVLEAQRRGLEFARLNTEDLPRARVRLGFESAADWSLQLPDQTLNGGDFTAAYFRRPGVPELDAAVLAREERAYCALEWSALLKSLYQRIGSRWLSAPAAIAAAEDKPRQLLAAKLLGFAVADTVVTNDIVVFDSFLEGPPAVAKPLRQARLEGATDRVMFTTRVDAAIARDARAIAAAPMILQREVPKAADIRVTIVGDHVFAAEIDSQALDAAEVDWRQADTSRLRHSKHELPSEEAARCVALVKALDLGFGAIDFVLDREGHYWFLEINPNGQWAWIETRTGHRIAAAIVDELISKAAS
jgi:glutathione synthase/RimK-type ligase-like ATP-grasp enzyme